MSQPPIPAPYPVRPARSIEVDRSLELVSEWMDTKFELPLLGWRFGLNPLIDFIPGIGDVTTAGISLYLMFAAVRYRVPKVTLLRMALNIGLEFVISVIPFIGPLFSAWWKPNRRNLKLLRARAQVSAEQARSGRASDWLFVVFIFVALVTLIIATFALSAYILWAIIGGLDSVGKGFLPPGRPPSLPS